MANNIFAFTPPDDTKPVNNKMRSDWNGFIDYLEKKGMKGKPDLDKGGLGYKMFDDYVKQTPGVSLSRESLPIIRKDLLNYRQWVLNEQQKPESQKVARLADNVTPQNFMSNVLANEKTADPNYPGTNLTSTRFPSQYLESYNQKLGLIPTNVLPPNTTILPK